jgi:hypothetical protein
LKYRKGLTFSRVAAASIQHHIFGYAGLTDIDAELEKPAMDPRCAPQRIGAAYLPDKLAYFVPAGRPQRCVVSIANTI